MRLKRAIDVLLGTTLAVLATPLILVLAVFSAAYLGAWPFFVQQRIGRNGRPFRLIKLRTLPKETPRYALKHALNGVELPHFLHFLRRRHLDELPQLWLVPLGTMSLVGPRPKMPDEFEPADGEYGRLRIQLRPGCTCLWQIGEHTHLLPSQSPQYDLYYLTHRSLRLDTWILWRTTLKMVGLAHSIDLSKVPAWARVVHRARRLPSDLTVEFVAD